MGEFGPGSLRHRQQQRGAHLKLRPGQFASPEASLNEPDESSADLWDTVQVVGSIPEVKARSC